MPGTGERLLEENFLKRIFIVSPLRIKTYLNINDSSDPKMLTLSSVLMNLLRLALLDAIVYSQILIFIAAIYKPIQ